SPVPSYVFILLGIRVFRELSKLRIRGVNGFTSSHVHGFVKSSSVGGGQKNHHMILWCCGSLLQPGYGRLSGYLSGNFPLFLPEDLLRNPTWHEGAVLASPGLPVGFMTVVTREVVFAIIRSSSE
nr:hypothetical protein [Tanacetum cinerariifolium]